jgi:hypothetical protein
VTRPACSGLGALMFSDDADDQIEAKEVCGICPLVVRCLTAALHRREPAGVWGGMTAEERRQVLTSLRRRSA